MTTLTSTARAGTANIPAVPGGRSSAIKAWAAVGAAFLALQIYVYGAWIISGDATPTSTGGTPVPTWMKWSLHGQEAFCVGLLVFFFYRFLYRPYRRDGKIGLDGLFVLAYPTLYWQDPLQNYIQPHATYNAEFVNLGAWTAHIPGWISPRSNLLAEPLLYAGPLYVIWIFGATVLACALMRRAKARWPQRGPLFLIGACFSFFFVFDFVSEVIFMRLGMYTYAGSIHAWTFFQGHYYQFPFYALLTYPVMATAFTCLRYFRDDQGHTILERGVDRLGVVGWHRSGIRFLALTGGLNVLMLVLFNLPLNIFAMHSGSWPEDIQKRSYLTDGICGVGTQYACPGPALPIHRPDSVHITPAGELVGP